MGRFAPALFWFGVYVYSICLSSLCGSVKALLLNNPPAWILDLIIRQLINFLFRSILNIGCKC